MSIRLFVSMTLVATLAACATRGNVYSRTDAGRPWTIRDATVVQVSEATIEGRETAIGTYGGGYIGHEVGRYAVRGSGSGVAGAVGSVAGAIAGQKAEKAATQQRAWEIVVEVEQGAETIAIVQPANESFTPGEKVRLYTRSDGAARVTKL